MPFTRQQKEDIVGEIKQLLRDSVIAIFLNFHGLSVKDGDTMRRDFRAHALRYRVVKKSLLARAISDFFGKNPPELKGEIGVVFGSDPLAATKEVVRAAKAIKPLTIQGGWWQNDWMDVRRLVILAAIPSRAVLLAQLAMLLRTPTRHTVGILAAIPRQFVGVLEAVRQAKEKGN